MNTPPTSSALAGDATPLIETRGLSVRFGGLVAVDQVDLRIRAGEWVGIIGPNGAGKTTLFNALTGVLAPTSGTLWVDGRSFAGAAPHRFARCGLARTFQTPRVFADLTVAANVAFGLAFAGRRKDRQDALGDETGILERMGLADLADIRASDLTPSQQRLLEIGMALSTRPRALLLDEVAAGLTEAEIEETAVRIRALREEFGLAVVWIEHAVGILLRHVERVVVLHQGRKIADGPTAAVIRDATVVEAYLGDELDATR
jgi:branched-chain amino acid transport system ATP-binding protein